jgi:hypothetical protein
MQMESMDKELRPSRLSEQLKKHYAAIAIPKGLYCLSLRLTDDKCHWPTTIIHVSMAYRIYLSGQRKTILTL